MFQETIRKLYYNLVIIIILGGIGILLSSGLNAMMGSLAEVNQPISLQTQALPGYMLRTITRFLVSMMVSLIVAIVYGTLAAKNKRMGFILMPIVNILQAIPVLGFLSFSVTFFVNLAPKTIFGIEMAIIFAIFSSQVWNMIFTVYQSMQSVPDELYQAAKSYGLNKWQVFWRLELPYSIPGLIWNVVLSMCASWYFVVASEVVAVGSNSYTVPGMGAYIALALTKMDFISVGYAFLAISATMVIFNELLFNPFIAWSYKFRYEFSIGPNVQTSSWFLDYLRKANITQLIMLPLRVIADFLLYIRLPGVIKKQTSFVGVILEILWWILIAWASYLMVMKLYSICAGRLDLHEVFYVIKLGLITTLRVMGLAIITSIFWVPIGIFVGLRPKVANIVQPINLFLTSIPANIYYPLFVIAILHFDLNTDIWLSVMIITGSQWYILYNVISGVQSIPTELLELGDAFKLTKFTKSIKIILPTILPSYLTGIITSTGASWNASVVSEIITWGDNTLITDGLGSYIAIHTKSGDFPEITLGLIVMSLLVIGINSLTLQPLYEYAANKFRLE